MSALGHKRTFRIALALSALHPRADICSAPAHVRLQTWTMSRRATIRRSLMPLQRRPTKFGSEKSRKLLRPFIGLSKVPTHYLDFGVASSLSTPTQGTDVLPAP